MKIRVNNSSLRRENVFFECFDLKQEAGLFEKLIDAFKDVGISIKGQTFYGTVFVDDWKATENKLLSFNWEKLNDNEIMQASRSPIPCIIVLKIISNEYVDFRQCDIVE